MRVLLVGTGTDVGKTHVTCALGALARARGQRVMAYKPLATGVRLGEACEDAALHARATGRPYVAPTFVYQRPISPHLAAREEQRPIDLAAIAACADVLSRDVEVLLVETAGGLFSPLDETRTMADLVLALSPDVLVLVAADRLGVLHEVRSTTLAAAAMGLPKPIVVLSSPTTPDDSTGTNSAELTRLGLGPVAAVFPRAPFDAAESLAAAASLFDGLAPCDGLR